MSRLPLCPAHLPQASVKLLSLCSMCRERWKEHRHSASSKPTTEFAQPVWVGQAAVIPCKRVRIWVCFSQPQSITQKGVHARLLTAREREHWFLQHLSHLPATNFGRQQREHPFCAILWRSPGVCSSMPGITPGWGYKFACVWSESFQPSQKGLCKFRWVWSSLRLIETNPLRSPWCSHSSCDFL